MKLAFVSDIHGNLPALEVVLAEIAKEAPDEILLLGDLLGHLGFPEETAAVARERRLVGVVGNIDLDVLRAPRGKAGRNDRATFDRLSAATVRWVGTLPWTRRIMRGGATLLLTHGTPRNPSEPLRPNLDSHAFLHLLGNGTVDIVGCGHTHMPSVAEIAGVLVVNPGSVGRPYDGDPRASYAIVEVREQARAYLRRVAYDVERTARAVAEQGQPESVAAGLRAGTRG